MPHVELRGCTPEPLASYLKSLGLLRILAEQLDPQARGWWAGGTFHIESAFGPSELVDALFARYEPTPIVAPWNGGSGFFPHKEKACQVVEMIERSTDARLRRYRETIQRARQILQRLGIGEKPDKGQKARILAECRAWLPDEALLWLDAAYVLTSEDPRYPPILGTGGNDGNLDFSSNFMQRLVDALALGEDGSSGRRRARADRAGVARAWLRNALFGDEAPPLVAAAVGQYHPGGVGGPNAAQGFEGPSLVNPWEFILLLEGSLLLAGSVARRLGVESEDRAIFPFTVAGVGTGYGTAVTAEYRTEASRAEVWLPLWERPAQLSELRQVFAEGRAQWGRRQARTGVDFARAAISLGVDRGITEFRRYGLLQRNGKAFLASPLGRLRVELRPEARLLHELDRWLNSFRRLCTGGGNVPAALWAALQAVDEAIFAFASRGREKLLDVLVAVGRAERLLAGRPRARGAHLQPVPGLSPEWHDTCYEETPEYRLAAALASIRGVAASAADRKDASPRGDWVLPPLRAYLEEVSLARGRWTWAHQSRSAVWGTGSLVRNLGKVLERRAVEAAALRLPLLPVGGTRPASLGDVDLFLRGQVDEQRLEELLVGLSLIDWTKEPGSRASGSRGDETPREISRAYALLKLVALDRPLVAEPGGPPVSIRPEPAIFTLLRANRVADACALAARRLRSSGFVPMVREPRDLATGAEGARLLAALLIPIWETRFLSRLVLRSSDGRASSSASPAAAPAGA